MEIDKPLITVIIPTYRRPQLLKRAIKSVLNQTFSDFQICVYDNASGDETRSIVEELIREDKRIKYYEHHENIGPLQNFNYGLKHVDTQFFSLLSDDDIVLPNFFETTLEGFKKWPDAMLSSGSTIVINTDKNKVIGDSLYLWEREGYYTPDEFIHKKYNHITWTGILFRKDIIDNIGVLDKEVGMASDMDWEIRILTHYPFVIKKEPCAIFVYHKGSFSGAENINYIWPGWFKIVGNIENDSNLSSEYKTHFIKGFVKNIKNAVFMRGMIAVKEKKFQDSDFALNILKNKLDRDDKYIILFLIATLSKYIPPLRYVLIFGSYLNRIYNEKQFSRLTSEYNKYLLDNTIKL